MAQIGATFADTIQILACDVPLQFYSQGLEVTGPTPIIFFPVNDKEHPIWLHRTLSLGGPTCTVTDPTLAVTAPYLLAFDHLTGTAMHHWAQEMERTRAAHIVYQELATDKEALAHKAYLNQFSTQTEITGQTNRLETAWAKVEEVR